MPFSRPELQNLGLLAGRGIPSLSKSVAIARQCSPGGWKSAVLRCQLLAERGLARGA
ncbi:hypothetical protein A2U01_0045106 [Trifolium medium]|uniref:Uncharacterized protein n=1 Tax=Trifolium medium TaxID=97028 RepID=A0A392QHQ2_9FABA|nr:hypothetical protein [Trifolium medium]